MSDALKQYLEKPDVKRALTLLTRYALESGGSCDISLDAPVGKIEMALVVRRVTDIEGKVVFENGEATA